MSASFPLTLKLTLVCLLCLGTLTLVTAGRPGYYENDDDEVKCPRGWTEFNCHCYQVTSQSVDYATAKAACAAKRGYLALIDSADENVFVSNLLLQNKGAAVTDPCGYYDYHAQSGWVGLNDIQTEGAFKWDQTGSLPFYTNWMTSPAQPDNGGGTEDCVEVYNSEHPNWAYQWNDKTCTCNRAYICELRPRGEGDSCCGLNY